MKNNNIIIGGGIAGLITAFYNKDYMLMSKDFGGQHFATNFPLGPRLVKYTRYTEQLLKDLDILDKISTRKVNVGYYYNNAFYTTVPDELKKEYYRKSRGLVYDAEPPESAMSDGETTFEVYNMTISDLIYELILRLALERRLTHDPIKSVNVARQRIHSEQRSMEYDKLVITVPLPIFQTLAKEYFDNFKDHLSTLMFRPITFILVKTCIFSKPYEYVYYPEKTIKANRATKFGDHFVLEITGDYSVSNCDNIKKLWMGQIQPPYVETLNVPNVKFIGRYAQWKHNVRISDVIKSAMELRNE